jgi:hypothetical protein
VFTAPLLSNGRLFLFHYFGFQPSCRNIRVCTGSEGTRVSAAASRKRLVVSQAARRWLLIPEPRVQSRVTSCEIHGAKWHWSRYVSQFVRLSPANHHSTTAPYSSITTLLRCAIALTRQHIITP